MTQKIKHITLTGVYAGMPFCDVDRSSSNDEFFHIGSWIDNKELNVCKDCLKVYSDALNEEE